MLTLFLRFRLALWVAAGTGGPVGAWPSRCSRLTGISVSTMSVMAFILVLGILVDDAIVVADAVYSYEQTVWGNSAAAMAGARRVSVPVIFGVLTTMATFIPIVNIPGPFGNFAPLGWTVILALIFSLIESQPILPPTWPTGKPEGHRQRRCPCGTAGWTPSDDIPMPCRHSPPAITSRWWSVPSNGATPPGAGRGRSP